MVEVLIGAGAVVLLNVAGAMVNQFVDRHNAREMWEHLAVAYGWWLLGPWALAARWRRRRRWDAARRVAQRAGGERPDEVNP